MRTLRIYGLVQGVGFRPYVATLAEKLHISGTVQNAGGIVIARIEGQTEAMEEFSHRLHLLDGKNDDLPGARVDYIETEEADSDGSYRLDSGSADPAESGFRIIKSDDHSEEIRFLPPDIATCDKCASELLDPKNRRYRYPFISCFSCGPRYTIMKKIPYDREHNTMANFPLCAECRADYERPKDRRCYAQTIACDECGPKLIAFRRGSVDERDTSGRGQVNASAGILSVAEKEAALSLAIETIKNGGLVAIKDIGGYHIAFDPYQSAPAKRLREFKSRERKPFAVMFPDLKSIRRYCDVSPKEAELLESDARPIVLLDRKQNDKTGSGTGTPQTADADGTDFAPEVCGSSRRIGAMLPCNPLQILLTREIGPLVMTSGNRGGEPMITSDEKMCEYLVKDGAPGEKADAGIDLVLANDREILRGLDDSIYQVTEDLVQIIRRARGLVPTPIRIEKSFSRDTFAAGGDLKSVFAFGRKNWVYLSGHYGDLEEEAAYEAMEKGVDHYKELFGFAPEIFAADIHPLYSSAKYAKSLAQTYLRREKTDGNAPEPTGTPASPLFTLQHHHAHIASVMAEHGLSGKVLGVAFDGTGYGTDGSVWGGEFLLCEGNHMERVGHLASVEMTGGDVVAKNADIPAMCYVHAAIERGYMQLEENPYRKMRDPMRGSDTTAGISADYSLISSAIEHHINTAKNSSAGRLFDGVCAILDLCHDNSYEGECPNVLQTAAEQYANNKTKEEGQHVTLQPIIKVGETYSIDTPKLIADLIKKKNKGVDARQLSFEFHHALARATVDVLLQMSEKQHITQVALSGGTFYNRLLLKMILQMASDTDLRIYINERVPAGDGGLALGQLYLTMSDEVV